MADANETPNGHGSARRPSSIGEEATNTVKRVRAAVEPDAESLEDQVTQLQADLKSVTATLNRMGHAAGNELKSGGQSALNYAQDEFTAIEKQLKDTIREKPLTAVAGALAAGFIIAVLTR